MDLYIKKEDLETDIYFDAVLSSNDLKKDSSYVTASLMCIFTDGSKNQIGTQIDGKVLGNKNYNIDKLSVENIKNYEDGLYECLQWLIDDKIVSSIFIETKKVSNILKVNISFTTDSKNNDNLIPPSGNSTTISKSSILSTLII